MPATYWSPRPTNTVVRADADRGAQEDFRHKGTGAAIESPLYHRPAGIRASGYCDVGNRAATERRLHVRRGLKFGKRRVGKIGERKISPRRAY